jgi:hypothetical protein
MRKKILPIVLFFIALSFALIGRASHNSYSLTHEPEDPAKKQNKFIIARTEVFGKLERPGVFFDHGLHAGKHEFDGCSTCHERDEAGQLSFSGFVEIDMKGKDSVRDAYHDKCIGCHRKLLQENKKPGPIKCGNCHRKQPGKLDIQYPHCVFDFYLHDQHVRKLDKDCSLCHHIYDLDEEDENLRLVYEESTEESCYYCHDLTVKRGPELAGILKVSEQKGLSIRKVAHYQCVNCHLWYSEKKEKAGPVECAKCHTGKYRTVSELLGVPRPDRGQTQKPILLFENAKMKGVPFDHEFHEKNNGSCRVCHHEALRACRHCHSLTGSSEGNWINLTNVYHAFSAASGCLGCHREKKLDRNCSGCHYHLPDIDIQAKGPRKEVCIVCHSGKTGDSARVRPISLSEIKLMNIPENVTIGILEEQYEPSTFPHIRIIKKLLEISNESRMATAFHSDVHTICSGCHHQSIPEAKIKKTDPPYCRNCHAITFDQQNKNRPRLLAVYHRQCMGCHERMGIKETGCTDCHKEKQGITKYIIPKNLTEP